MSPPETTLRIKNMVCSRCLRVVRERLEGLGLPLTHLELGRADIALSATAIDLEAVRRTLEAEGFSLIENERVRQVERIKAEIIALVQQDRLGELRTNLSIHLSENLEQDYASLSSLFSALEGITLERYFILQKTERVKELLAYGELTVSEIAHRLGYSSGAHLTNRFRQETGFTPTQYRREKHHARQPLDEVG